MIFNQADSPVSNLDAGIDFGGHRWAFRAFFPSSFPGTDWGNLGSGYLSRLMAAWWRFDRLDRPRSMASIFSDQESIGRGRACRLRMGFKRPGALVVMALFPYLSRNWTSIIIYHRPSRLLMAMIQPQQQQQDNPR